MQSRQGSVRIAWAAFQFPRKNGKKNVTVVTKANIVKLADGNFIKAVRKVGEEYPEIEIQERLVDAMILDQALDICIVTERKVKVTTFPEDASAEEFTDYLLDTIRKIKES